MRASCSRIILLLCIVPGLLGAGYPDKPVRIVVPFPAASVTDSVARPVAAKLSADWGQPVVLDNRPGAGGSVGAEIGAKAAPDGYTLLLGSQPPNAVNVSLYRKLAYDPVRDFVPISLVATTYQLLVVHPGLPAKSVQELIALAKAKPGVLNYGSSGNGSSPHLATALFLYMTGTSMNHIPYKGSPQYTVDNVAGRVELVFSAIGSALPHVKSGRLRLLAISATARDPAMPDVPTVAEAGVPGYDMTTWYGFLAPRGTPAPVVGKVHTDLLKVLAQPEIKAQLATGGLAVTSSTPAEFGTLIKRDIEKWGKVVKASGMQVD